MYDKEESHIYLLIKSKNVLMWMHSEQKYDFSSFWREINNFYCKHSVLDDLWSNMYKIWSEQIITIMYRS